MDERASASGARSTRRRPTRSSGSPTNLAPRRARARGDAAPGRPLPRRRGAPDHRGLPGRREDDAREGARALGRLLVLADAVHARPAALGRDRRERLQPAHERVRVPARPGVREPRCSSTRSTAPRRRRRRRCSSACRRTRSRSTASATSWRAPFMVDGDAEPDRVRGHVPAARGAARPLHAADRDRLPAARRGGADADRADERPAARVAPAGRDRGRACAR